MLSHSDDLEGRHVRSRLASPWLWLIGRRPSHILAANVVAFLATQLLAIALLGGYTRERDTHPTAMTDALEQLGFLGGIAALMLALAYRFMSSRAWARNGAALILAFAWPILVALTWVTLQAKL